MFKSEYHPLDVQIIERNCFIMKKVVIIGAGPAGLTAGYELLKDKKDEYEVVILEAENQVGRNF